MVIVIIVLTTVLAACAGEATPTPTATTPAPTATTPAPTATAPKTTAPVSTPTPTKEAKWWDKLGEPTYGGELVMRGVTTEIDSLSFDPLNPLGVLQRYTPFYLDSLFQPDWTVDRNTWGFQMGYIPAEYLTGALAESWEQTDPLTWIVHIRQGVHFENRAPVNGRELTAKDVEYSYDRLLGTGNGFTEPNPYWSLQVPSIERVVATDTYTVEFRFKRANAFTIDEIMQTVVMYIVPHEWVEQGDLDNWKNAIGSGPFRMKEYIRGTSISFSRNPDYWGVDERHPENQIPYVDEVRAVQIPDMATSLAALRTGKIDMIVQSQSGMSLAQAQSLAKNSPEITQYRVPNGGWAVLMRCDTAPFNDIRVRTAMQMAIDLKAIAKSHYSGLADGKPCGLVNQMFKGFATPYDEWPQSLKDEYSYNPTKAKALLAEAGYPNGFKTNCKAISTMDIELLQIIKAMLMDIGVDMEIDAREGAAMMPLLKSGGYDQMSFWGQTGATFNPCLAMKFRQSKNGNNYTKNNDAHYDELMSQFDAAATLEEAKQISVEADRYLLEQHWAIQTFPIVATLVSQPYVKGWLGEQVMTDWHAFIPSRVWIDQEMKKSMGY
jgi:peptide/nickel transport system substrate-binding protein